MRREDDGASQPVADQVELADEKENSAARVRAAIHVTGLSSRAFAESIAWRDERTVRRWVSGEIEPPATVAAQLDWLLCLTAHQISTLVNAATDRPGGLLGPDVRLPTGFTYTDLGASLQSDGSLLVNWPALESIARENGSRAELIAEDGLRPVIAHLYCQHRVGGGDYCAAGERALIEMLVGREV